MFAGKRIATMVHELGVSQCWVSREAHAPETRSLLGQLLISKMIGTVLDAISEGMKARGVVVRRARLIDAGPDHRPG